MQIFSQENCPSREILLTTVYHHRNSRITASEAPEFSFLVETLPSKPDQQEEQVQDQISRLQEMNQTILESMYLLDQKIKNQLAKKGRMEYLKLTDGPFPSTNQSLHYKRSMGNPTEFSEVQRQASVFEVDENNNFTKYKEKTLPRHVTSLTNSLILHQGGKSKPTSKVKPTSYLNNQKTNSKRKRVYESVLSKFTTASLLKMNGEEV